MSRPFNYRKVNHKIEATYFKPKGVAMRELQTVNLAPDEVEALRLADLENLYQIDAAKEMAVSRQTFGNIIKSARRKVADAMLNSKAIVLQKIGSKLDNPAYICKECGKIWQVSDLSKLPSKCTKECNDNSITICPQTIWNPNNHK